MSKQHSLKLARFDEEDYNRTLEFLSVLDQLFDNRWACSHDGQWEDWDDEDEDKQELLSIRKELSKEEQCNEEDVDNRLILFEFIKRKYRGIDCRWRRVLMAAEVLNENVCDPLQDTLQYHPYIERALEDTIMGE